MQLGMIGLGRMGANLVRRLHDARVTSASCTTTTPPPSTRSSAQGAVGATSVADLVAKLDAAACGVADGAGGRHRRGGRRRRRAPRRGRRDHRRRQLALRRRHRPRRTRSRRAGIDYVDCGTSGGVFGLERGFCLMIGGPDAVVHAARPDLPRARARARRAANARPDAPATPRPRRWATCTAARPGAGHFVKMVHNGIEYALMAAYAEGLDDPAPRRRRARRRAPPTPRPRRSPSRALPVRPRHPEGRGGVAPRQRRRVVAARPHRGRAAGVARRSPSSAAGSATPAKAAGRSPPRSTRAFPRR